MDQYINNLKQRSKEFGFTISSNSILNNIKEDDFSTEKIGLLQIFLSMRFKKTDIDEYLKLLTNFLNFI